MSRRNGDKSRFHRLRKQGIDRRKRQRRLFSADVQPEATLANQPKTRSSAPPDETTTSR
jgi:hypothetical protein